jgi:hypothetical protein
MATNYNAEITSATNTNILVGIVRNSTTRNKVAREAGIPLTTFSRKINGHGDFTLAELGSIAGALDLTMADLIPMEKLSQKVPA